ncbi:pyridine nucleotide-disulfide oxidoreductase [Exiguobacterium sp. SH0S1]|uniref:FAD-dependent oxidoreductase n=1 Tax=Exiguobacterium sp. SH0S1 TaxID=2510949 RepID=UPI00103B6035|nr:FAD-dependent oxidoreductase [Exiguobacterium sp. SH0S1]TCI80581.1 pyridine nucleotide-disulfide oxidoreductase [Exiguobacterium sp. SH0S1]
MKPRLILVGLGHGQLEILARIEQLRERYEVSYVGLEETIYTGAFPQVIANEMASAVVNLRPDVTPVASRLISLDPVKRIIETDQGMIAYDHLVLATGAKSRGIGTGLKPMTDVAIEHIQASRAVTIVGGGKAGVELAFACVRSKQHVTLYAKQILPDLPNRVGRHIARRLVASGVTLIAQQYEGGDAPDGLVLDATGVVPVEWWHRSGLAEEGSFIPTDAYLRHATYQDIYITGDMAMGLNGGVDAVRSGRHVASALLGDQKPYKQRTSLNILLTTPGHALLTFGRLTWHGRCSYWIKRQIDRRYMQKFTH